MIETIVRYLVQGVSETDIAGIVGCSIGYVSQVKARPDFAELAEEQAAAVQASEQEKLQAKKYTSLEDKILTTLEEQLPFAEFNEVTRLLEILHKRKGIGKPAVVVNNNNDNRTQTVVLSVPQAAVPEIQLNANREVIGIDGQSLAPMGSMGVKALFVKMTQEKMAREDAAAERKANPPIEHEM